LSDNILLLQGKIEFDEISNIVCCNWLYSKFYCEMLVRFQ